MPGGPPGEGRGIEPAVGPVADQAPLELEDGQGGPDAGPAVVAPDGPGEGVQREADGVGDLVTEGGRVHGPAGGRGKGGGHRRVGGEVTADGRN